MRNRWPKIMIAILMFGVGYSADSYIRGNVGMNCFGCNTLARKIVTVADNPGIAIQHPMETLKSFF